MKSKLLKSALLVVCAFALVAVSVLGTMAYFTSKEKVENHFTVGKVTIGEVTETKVDEYGEPIIGEDRVGGNQYKLIPDATYTKDPQIVMGEDSEDCWLFVQLKNDIASLMVGKDKDVQGQDPVSIEGQLAANGWAQLNDAAGAPVAGVYFQKWTKGSNTTVKTFEHFTVKADADTATATKDIWAAVDDDTTFTITVYAVQDEGLDTAIAAWGKAPVDD